MRFRLTGILLVSLLSLPHTLPGTTARAATWLAEHDPEIPQDQIGSVVQQASSGDTILVGPGTYYEHIDLGTKSLVIVGLEGASRTVLDGSRKIPERQGSILYASRPAGDHLVVDGVSFRNGVGFTRHGIYFQGGAIYWDGQAVIGIVDCAFESNSVSRNDELGSGGAIYVGGAEARIERCEFRDNMAFGSGGALDFAGTRLFVKDCTFEIPDTPWGGSGLHYYAWNHCSIRGCTFLDSSYGFDGTSLSLNHAGEVEIAENLFVSNVGGSEILVVRPLYGPEDTYQKPVVRGNVFWNRGPHRAKANFFPTVGDVELVENTFIDMEVIVAVYRGVDHDISRNIFFGSPVELWLEGGSVSCNDFWPDSLTIELGNPTVEDNVFGNPLLCSPETGDFHISVHSPCAPDNSPAGCGLIGVLEPACDISPTRRTTWGQIKVMYR